MTILRVTRREFVAALGGAAAWPVAARGQANPKVPLIGFLGTETFKEWTARPCRRGHRMNRRKFSKSFGRGVVEFCSTSVLVSAGILAVTTAASLADTIDATTLCPVAIQAFELRETRWTSPCGRAVASRARSR